MSPRPSRGRPRRQPGPHVTNPREHILASAAELFVNQSYAGTTTREIGELAGMRQASIYYHFDSKEQILVVLLRRSVQLRVERAAKIATEVDGLSPAAGLYLLAASDVSALAAMPQNVGILYRLPDVVASPVFEQFRDLRDELVLTYGQLGIRAAPQRVADTTDVHALGELLVQIADTMTGLRAAGSVDSSRTRSIASACLRLCGIPEDVIDQARVDIDIDRNP
ncbi:helix-turn-helix domain-containing protein [Nocardioides sp. CCNWLW239]|uniref:TetR/AcrR family transcriptional regulator n=1 Tax=Nocardioides sp. CCNWLW239 TaxID=3128902 RepID=UPI00301A031C